MNSRNLEEESNFQIWFYVDYLLLVFESGAAFELVEQPVDFVHFPTKSPQLRIGWVAFGQQFVGVFVQSATYGTALIRAHSDKLLTEHLLDISK